MTTSVSGRGLFAYDWNPLRVIYKIDLPACSHSLTIFTRKETKNGKRQIYETCVECGKYMSKALSLSDHAEHWSYPYVDDHWQLSVGDYEYRRTTRCRVIDHTVNEIGEHSGGEVCSWRLYHSGDIYYGSRIADCWNRLLDDISHKDIPRERARALQFGLSGIWHNDGTIWISVAVSFDPNKYAEVIAEELLKRIPITSLDLNSEVNKELTRFGDGFRYSEYLTSTQWIQVKKEAIYWEPNRNSAMTGMPVCESPNCSGKVGKVDCHHLTYERAGHEEPGDVIFLCAACHANAEHIKAVTPKLYIA